MGGENPTAVNGIDPLRNPLNGLLICSKCGRTMVLRSHPQYAAVRCVDRHCNCPGSQLVLVEKRVLEGLAGWLEDYRLKWSDSSGDDKFRVDAAEKALATAESEVSKVRGMIARTHELLEQGVYDTETFLERSRALADKLSAAEETVARCSSELTAERPREENKRNISCQKYNRSGFPGRFFYRYLVLPYQIG